MSETRTDKPEAGSDKGQDATRQHPEPDAGPLKPAEPLVVHDPGLPDRQGLYNPANEKDACGVGFIADMKNRKSHAIVEQGLAILKNLDHRGAVGADPMMGDGCGMLVQIPHGFFAEECAKLGIDLAGARPLRHRPSVHAARPGRLPHRRGDRHQGRRGRGPRPARLARRAGRQP